MKNVKTNILYITHDSGLYGASYSLLDILKFVDRSMFEPYVIVPYSGPLLRKLRELKIQYKIVKMYQTVAYQNEKYKLKDSIDIIKTNYEALRQIVAYIDEQHIDIVHSNVSVINLGAIAAELKRVPHVWHVRETPIQFGFKKFGWDRFLMSRSAAVVCISQYIMQEVKTAKTQNNIRLCYDPLNIEKYDEKKNYFNSNIINIFVCGAISKNKGQMDVVKAVKILHDAGYDNVHLNVVGSGNKQYVKQVETYMKKNNMQKYACLRPFTDDIQQYRRNADIAVMSSVYEALGRVTIESMLSELAVVGADSGATSELIVDGYTGLKYEPHNPQALAERIIYIINHKEETIQMIKNAKKYAMETFDAKKKIKEIENIYQQIFRRKSI